MKKILVLIYALSACSYKHVAGEIRYIIPPKLDSSHLGKRIVCHRPMREISPKMDLYKLNSKIIVNNYGHGGSGWTLAPGSASYVVNLLKTQLRKDNISNTEPITIIGGGALGLFTAIELVDKNYINITIVAESFENLTSHNAGGRFGQSTMSNSRDMQVRIDNIASYSYKFYKDIALKKHKYFDSGARIMPSYFKSREISELDQFAGKIMKPAKDMILDFGNGTKRPMVAYDDNIFIDTHKMMYLLKDILKDKVKFVTAKISSFDQIKDSIIINATGIGARELANDDQMMSVQGHLVMLKNQNPQDLDYMISIPIETAKTNLGFDVKRSFYIFPKQELHAGVNDIGVIGGTFIKGADSLSLHEEEFDIMINNAKEFYGLR